MEERKEKHESVDPKYTNVSNYLIRPHSKFAKRYNDI